MRLLLLLFLTLNLLNAQKIALLIGNSRYTYLDRLSSPSKDIPALAQKLRDMDFEVTELYNLDKKAMKKAIKNFKMRLQRNPNAIALFYYSGHGSQAYGDSYLIPIDGDTRDEADVESDGVEVEWIAKKMALARTKANILFLDACRDVPTGEMGGTKGLGQVRRQPSSTLILYSTSKNKTAKDDRVFNRTVLSKLGANMAFDSLANSISYLVAQKTNGEQRPELLSTGLPPMLCLSGSCGQPQVKVVEKIVYRDRVVQQPTRVNSSTNNPNIVTIDGLMYQNQPFTKRYTWQEAKEYCQDLTLGGYSNWRLPTRAELNKISNIKMYGEWDNNWKKWYYKNKHKKLKGSKGTELFVRKEFLENMQRSSYFWTSEAKDYFKAWHIGFGYGGSNLLDKSGKNLALCVR